MFSVIIPSYNVHEAHVGEAYVGRCLSRLMLEQILQEKKRDVAHTRSSDSTETYLLLCHVLAGFYGLFNAILFFLSSCWVRTEAR
jgi:hypothetical protein